MAYMSTPQFAGFGAFDLRARRFRPKRWLRHMMPMNRVASKTGVPLMPYGTAKDMVAFSASRPMMQPSKQVVMKDVGARVGTRSEGWTAESINAGARSEEFTPRERRSRAIRARRRRRMEIGGPGSGMRVYSQQDKGSPYIPPRRKWGRPVHSNLFHRRGRRRKFLAPGIPGRFSPTPKAYARGA